MVGASRAEASGAEHLCEMADELDSRRVIVAVGGRDDHLVDQRASGLEGVGRRAGDERLAEPGDAFAVDLGEAWMQRRQDGPRHGEGGTQRGSARLELVEPGLQAGRAQPVGDRLDEIGELALDCGEVALVGLGGRGKLGSDAVPLGAERVGEGGEQVGAHQPPAERIEHLRFERPAADAAMVAARPLLAAEAAEIVLAEQGERPTADATDDLPGQQVALAPAVPEPWCDAGLGPRRGLGGKPRLGAREGRAVNDGELRHLGLDEGVGGVGAAQPSAGGRILDAAEAVPDGEPGIERVAQDAAVAARPAAQIGVGPGPAGRPGHALGVECAGDREGAGAVEIGLEDAPHDRGLGRLDRAQATLELAIRAEPAQHAVPVGRGAEGPALADPSLGAAMGLRGEILEIERAHGALETDRHLADLALGEGDDPHAGELRLLVEGGGVLEVAREPVEALGEDDLDLARAHRREQGLIAWAIGKGAGEGCVGETAGDGPALLHRVRGADAQLVVDRGVALQVGGEAGIERDAQHGPARLRRMGGHRDGLLRLKRSISSRARSRILASSSRAMRIVPRASPTTSPWRRTAWSVRARL
jgi:hypothetical protein